MANTYSEQGSGQRLIFSSAGPIYFKQLHCSFNCGCKIYTRIFWLVQNLSVMSVRKPHVQNA